MKKNFKEALQAKQDQLGKLSILDVDHASHEWHEEPETPKPDTDGEPAASTAPPPVEDAKGTEPPAAASNNQPKNVTPTPAPKTGKKAGTNKGAPKTGKEAGTNKGAPKTGKEAGTNKGAPKTGKEAGTNKGAPKTGKEAGTNKGAPETKDPQKPTVKNPDPNSASEPASNVKDKKATPTPESKTGKADATGKVPQETNPSQVPKPKNEGPTSEIVPIDPPDKPEENSEGTSAANTENPEMGTSWRVRWGTSPEEPANKEPEIDLRSVLEYEETIPPDAERQFANNFRSSIKTCQILMTLLGRFPVLNYTLRDGVIEFQGCYAIRLVIFVITFLFLAATLAFSCVGIASILLDYPRQHNYVRASWGGTMTWKTPKSPGKLNWQPLLAVGDKPIVQKPMRIVPSGKPLVVRKSNRVLRAEEMFIFRRNWAALTIILLLLGHIVISDYNLFRRHKSVSQFLMFFEDSAEIMKIDASWGSSVLLRKILIYFVIWFAFFAFAVAVNIAPVSSGSPLFFSITCFRPFYPPVHTFPDFYITIMRGVGGFVFMYVIIASKVYAIFFLFICKNLKTTCSIWNERLESVFTEEARSKDRKYKCITRTGYDHLFKDYLNILDLISGADSVFAHVIESFIVNSAISMILESYYLVRPLMDNGHRHEFENARIFDVILVALTLFNSACMFYLVIAGASQVGDAYAEGLETVRRQAVMGHRSEEELHFLLSLYMSYTGPLDGGLSSAGYVCLDKPFVVGIISLLVGFLIGIFQVLPALAVWNEVHLKALGPKDSDDFRIFITHVESTFYYLHEPVK